MSELPTSRRLPLPNYASLFAISGMIQKKLFGGPHVPAFPFATQGLLLFWEGAVAGRLHAKDMTPLVLASVGSEAIGMAYQSAGLTFERAAQMSNEFDSVASYILQLAPDGLKHYGGEPDSLLDLFCVAFSPADMDFRTVPVVKALSKARIPAETAALQGSTWFLAGLSLGCTRPDTASRLLENVYGQRDPIWWSETKKAGALGPPLPEEIQTLAPTGAPSDVREIIVQGVLSGYASQHYPELLEPLGLLD